MTQEIAYLRPVFAALFASIAMTFPLTAIGQSPQGVEVTSSEKRGLVVEGMTQPKPTHEVMPLYPPLAASAGIEGDITIDMTISRDGSVKDLVIGRHVPALDDVALSAVRQWRYEPVLFNGAPVEVVIHKTVTFNARAAKVSTADDRPTIRINSDGNIAPKIIKQALPLYPTEAQRAGTTGMVIFELIVDKAGKVKDLHVLRHASPALEQAATEAVRQWLYEPARVNGAVAEIVFTATVKFSV